MDISALKVLRKSVWEPKNKMGSSEQIKVYHFKSYL